MDNFRLEKWGMNIFQRPLISVVVPVYNVENYIDRCVKSVISQTYKNLDIILVDDGATDTSGNLCDVWKRKDERITVVHKENGGLSSARNIGIDNVKGEYIMFVDSDDIIADNIVEILYNQIVKNSAEIAICEAVHIFEKKDYMFTDVNVIRCFTPEEAVIEMWYQKSFLPSAWGKLYKSDLFKKNKFTENRLYEDIDIMHEVFWDARKIVYCDAKLYGYVHREQSITTQRFSKRDLDILVIAEKLICFSKNKSEAMKKAARAYATVAALRIFLNAPDVQEFESCKKNAVCYLNKYGKSVLRDDAIRKKHRYALILFFYFRPIIRSVYKKVDRWK